MRKFLLSIFISLLLVNITFGQATLPHYEAMDYTSGGTLQTQTGWVAMNTGDDLLISSGSLTYSGLPASTGNKVVFDGSGIDAAKLFTAQASGTVYCSFLMNITALGSLDATNGGYFTGFTDSATNFGANVWIRMNGVGYNIGLSPRTATTSIVWSAQAYNINSTLLIVTAYEIVSGTGNDIVKLWVNPTLGASEPAVTLTATNTGGNDLTKVTRLLIRQDSGTETPSIEMDEIRIGTNWADVTPTGVAANPVTSITVTSANDSTTISTAGGTLQMSATVLPVDATNSTITWSVIDGTGHATISTSGLVTAVLTGTVTVRATANDGSGVFGEFNLTLNNQNPAVLVSSITVAGLNDSTTISTYHGTLQMIATVNPNNATDSTFVWSVVNGTGSATINSAGLLTAVSNGVVTVKATANDVSGVFGTIDITLSNQILLPKPIYDIQYSTNQTGDSPLNGQVVTVRGIVTAKHYNYEGGTYKGFFVQDADGAYNGVYVYNSTNNPTVGDDVTITATVKEFNSLTELDPVSSFVINSSGNPLPNATLLSTSEAATEAYEGVLIKVKFAKCTTNPSTYNDFTVNDGTGNLNVDDDIYKFVPTLNSYYDITGVGHYAYSLFKILPRSVSDVSVSVANTEANIVSFSLAEQTGTATINSSNNTITVEVFTGTDRASLIPTIAVSSGATINPNSGIAQNFTSPVTYSVTAQDGSTTKTWTVTVTVATNTQSNQAEILTFSFPTDKQAGDAVINSVAGTVNIDVFPDVDRASLTPTITTSVFSTINPTSGTVGNFSSPVSYIVTAQDGTTKTWTVTVNSQTITPIYDIQYTTATPAISPKNNQTVTITGIVTAVHDNLDYYVQDANGAWNGINVIQDNAGFAIGDSIFVTGLVGENYSYTVLKNVTSSKYIDGFKNIAPVYLTIADANTENYEGVLVTVFAARCYRAPKYGDWSLYNGTDSILVEDVIFPDADLVDVGKYYQVTGVQMYSYSVYSIYPRSANDIVFVDGIDHLNNKSDLQVYPNPVINKITIENTSGIQTITLFNILGSKVMEVNPSIAKTIELDLSSLEKGIYMLNIISTDNNSSSVRIIKQ
ncbi:MAG: hypothetical protein A2033_10530 [Bacteroidetes bacterium GWA2_31_9]|nr:MAG: hypothetical protein A2033_10530 [Bacteroidetes bacterium GWA2_31_9]